jgi:PAS domain S-box-containing protein
MADELKRTKVPHADELVPLVIALVVVLLTGFLAYRAAASFRHNSEQESITRQVVDATNGLLSSLTNAEMGQRGYLLTGDDRYLDPYTAATTAIPAALAELSRLEATPAEAELVERLRPLVEQKMDELAITIELRHEGQAERALSIVRTDRGKNVMDQIRQVCAGIQRSTYGRASLQAEEARMSGSRAALISVIGGALLFVLLAYATVTLNRGHQKRHELIAALSKSEREARESRDWLRTTLASIGDAVITTEDNGNITLLNDVAQALTGWTQAEAAGKPLEQVFVIRNEETGLEVENPVSKVLREGRIVGLANHTKLIAKDGRSIPIDDSAAPIRSGPGSIAGVVLVFRDITERKAAELTIAQNIEDLQISNTSLLRANEDLSQFAFAASHDLQEPLRMIATYSQLLLKRLGNEVDEEAAVCVQFITEGTARMRQLLADLLAYTQLSSMAQDHVESVDLNQVFQSVLQNCRTAIDETQASVTSGELPTLAGHQSHFVQLFQNLISNALKYRSERPPRVHVSAERLKGSWRFAVADNGIGIAPEYHKQIFGVFKRLHGRNIPGTGIGLAICQRIVDRYGGEIGVESKPGEGSTFFFTLPAESEKAAHGE